MDAPSPSELERRITSLEKTVQSSMAALNSRLDSMPTEATLSALFQVRDQTLNVHSEDIRELSRAVNDERRARESAIVKERSERENADKEIVRTAEAAKRWAITTIISGGLALIAVITFVLSLKGGGGVP